MFIRSFLLFVASLCLLASAHAGDRYAGCWVLSPVEAVKALEKLGADMGEPEANVKSFIETYKRDIMPSAVMTISEDSVDFVDDVQGINGGQIIKRTETGDQTVYELKQGVNLRFKMTVSFDGTLLRCAFEGTDDFMGLVWVRKPAPAEPTASTTDAPAQKDAP